MADTQQLLADALRRIERLEDEAEVRNLLSCYGLATDGGQGVAIGEALGVKVKIHQSSSG